MTDSGRPGTRSISNVNHITYRRIERMAIAAVFAGVLALVATLFWAFKSIKEEDIWAIGIYAGNSPLKLTPHSSATRQPVLSATDVTDATAKFVADPFLVRKGGQWLMFFEVLNSGTKRGEIAYASSDDAIGWRYEKIILREAFHLSYPYVFEVDQCFYMIPESSEARSIRLYRAVDFPEKWVLVTELLRGDYRDSSLIHKDGRWWLFALRNNSVLSLHFADELLGPWTEHPLSPLTKDPRLVRPAGRIIQDGNRLLRYSQDGQLTYGHSVVASEITELTPLSYAENLTSDLPIIGPSRQGWNANGMHQIDAQNDENGRWIAAVDGKYIRRSFAWRRGARAIVNIARA